MSAACLFVMGATWRAVRDLNLTKYERNKYMKQEKWPRRFIFISSVGLLFLLDSTDGMFAIALWLVSLPIVDYLLDLTFRRSLALVFGTSSVIVFSAILYVESNVAIRLIETGPNEQEFSIMLPNSEFTSENYSIIGSSDRYLFLWARSEDRVQIVPHVEIKEMSLSKGSE